MLLINTASHAFDYSPLKEEKEEQEKKTKKKIRYKKIKWKKKKKQGKWGQLQEKKKFEAPR